MYIKTCRTNKNYDQILKAWIASLMFKNAQHHQWSACLWNSNVYCTLAHWLIVTFMPSWRLHTTLLQIVHTRFSCTLPTVNSWTKDFAQISYFHSFPQTGLGSEYWRLVASIFLCLWPSIIDKMEGQKRVSNTHLFVDFLQLLRPLCEYAQIIYLCTDSEIGKELWNSPCWKSKPSAELNSCASFGSFQKFCSTATCSTSITH